MSSNECFLPTKRKIEEIITESYKNLFGTNYDENSLDNAKRGALTLAEWLMNNR